MSELLRLQGDLEARSALGKGATTMGERVALGYVRCAAFVKATQSKGTPGCSGSYGTGKASSDDSTI